MVGVKPQSVAYLDQLLGHVLPGNPLLHAGLVGESPGLAIVDSVSAPTACLVRMQFLGATYFAAQNQRFLEDSLHRARHYGEVRLLWEGEGMSSLRVPEGASEEWENLTFSDRESPSGPPPPLPDGCRLEPTFQDVGGRSLWKEFTGLCNPPREFHHSAMGYALMRDDEVLCEPWAPFWGGRMVDIGIVTVERHRKKGYATVACEHLIRDCEMLGWKPVWHTSRANLGSVRVAEKLGFRSVRSCPGYLYPGLR